MGPAAFWLLAFLLSNPEALKAVRTEFSRVSHAHTLEPTQPTPVFGKSQASGDKGIHGHGFMCKCWDVAFQISLALVVSHFLFCAIGR